MVHYHLHERLSMHGTVKNEDNVHAIAIVATSAKIAKKTTRSTRMVSLSISMDNI